MLERFFRLSERGSSVRAEVMGGVTTFVTMAYIIVVNPAILSFAGIPVGPSTTATVVSAACGTLLMVGEARHIDFDDLTERFPAFATIAKLVFTHSTWNGQRRASFSTRSQESRRANFATSRPARGCSQGRVRPNYVFDLLH